MIFDKMFNNTDILGSAMQASIVRHDVIVNNIANADVPGFKKKTVEFEKYLRSELDSPTQNVDLSKLAPTVHIEHGNYNYRIDGNNVDIEAEMVDLYQNTVRYDVLANGVMGNYKKLNLVLSSLK